MEGSQREASQGIGLTIPGGNLPQWAPKRRSGCPDAAGLSYKEAQLGRRTRDLLDGQRTLVEAVQGGQGIGIVGDDLQKPFGFVQADGLADHGLFQNTDRAAQIRQFLFLLP